MSISRSVCGFRIFPWILAGVLFFALTGRALATWSIVIANTETGEVAVGSATCLPNFDLKKGAGGIVVGKGAAQAQASVDTTGQNRQTMVNGLLQGLTAQEILDLLKATDPKLETHQYGIAELQGGAVTFTGSKTMAFTSGLTGKSGPMVYAIQGNVLTGEGVLLAAEEALVHTPGDLGQKLMAAMHAAKYFGGDGRCSCKTWDPTGCGSPPNKKAKKENKWKSAHVAYMVIARIGDTDGTFGPSTGFANGSYYMDLNVVETTPIDPVDMLQPLFEKFRSSLAGRADHILSQKTIYPSNIPADGKSEAELMIALVDIDDHLITHGGASITVTHDVQSAGASMIGPVVDHGDGTYSVTLTSSFTTGVDVFRIGVEGELSPVTQGRVTLYPFPTLEVTAPSLLADTEEVSAFLGSPIGFSLSGGNDLAGRIYIVLGSSSGTEPGFLVNGVQVPLNPDLFSLLLLYWTGSPIFPDGLGTLDVNG